MTTEGKVKVVAGQTATGSLLDRVVEGHPAYPEVSSLRMVRTT